MKTYNYKEAKRYIQMHSDIIESASLGMAEDWWWTADAIYEDSKFIYDLDAEPVIAGIGGSIWATPTLEVEFKDGSVKSFPCYIGESSESKPPYFELGVISQEVQDIRDGKFLNTNTGDSDD